MHLHQIKRVACMGFFLVPKVNNLVLSKIALKLIQKEAAYFRLLSNN